MQGWGIGMLIVVGAGVPLGLLLGSSRLAYHSTHLTVEFLRTIPSIAALPFLILIYGAGTKLAVVLVVLSSIWPLSESAGINRHGEGDENALHRKE